MLIQQPICTDDYGDSWYLCHFSRKPTHVDRVEATGAMVPGVKARFYMDKGAGALRKQSRADFCAMDANCNTCREFQRVPHQKEPSGFLRGRCESAPESHPLMYRKQGPVFCIHPDDAMLMPCYQARVATC